VLNKIPSSSDVRVACGSCSLKNLCLPYGLDQADMEHLDTIISRPKPIEKNQFLFQAGQTFRSISVVRSGSIKTFTVAPNGEQQITGFHLPGELLGFDGVRDNVHVCSAKALETTSVCKLPFDNLQDMCGKIPGLLRQLHRVMSSELIEEQQMLLQIGKMNAEQRLATFLVTYAKRLSSRGFSETEFNLCMSRTDIGNYLGLAIETISRQFSQFKTKGVVETVRKFVRILDLEELQKLSGSTNCNKPLDV